MTNPKNILVLGSTGRTGINLIQQLAKLNDTNKPKIFAFCRDPSRMEKETKLLCDSVLKGNATSPSDLESALEDSGADCVFVAIGNGQNLSNSGNSIRTENAKALVQVLRKPQYSHVKVMIISSNGAGGSKILVGFGIGQLIAFHLRHVLRDHDGQEAIFLSSLQDRTLIVRPTALTEFDSTGKLVTFGDTEKPPTIATDRLDLANWVVKDAVFGTAATFGSKPINLTGVKD